MAVLQRVPLGLVSLYLCDAAPSHSATAGDVAIYTAGTADTFLYVCTGGSTWTANATGGGGGGSVSSVFGRSGVVVAASGDYTEAQVTRPIASKTTTYTLAATDYCILGDATGASFTVTLPAVASSTGKEYRIKKTDSTANTVTLKGNAAETIDGANTAVLTRQFEAIDVVCNGTAWSIC